MGLLAERCAVGARLATEATDLLLSTAALQAQWIKQINFSNAEGYTKGSAMTYAKDLKGRLLIYYGTADNNVHPNNSMQLIKALQQAGKSFEVQVGPDAGHTGVNNQRMMEFFIENLVMKISPVS